MHENSANPRWMRRALIIHDILEDAAIELVGATNEMGERWTSHIRRPRQIASSSDAVIQCDARGCAWRVAMMEVNKRNRKAAW